MRTFLQMTSLLPASSLDSNAIMEALNTSVKFNQVNMLSLLCYIVSGWVNQNTSETSVQVFNGEPILGLHGLRKITLSLGLRLFNRKCDSRPGFGTFERSGHLQVMKDTIRSCHGKCRILWFWSLRLKTNNIDMLESVASIFTYASLPIAAEVPLRKCP